MQEVELAARRHDQQPIRLGNRAGHLGEELGAGHADRDRETHLLADPVPQSRGDLGCRARDPIEPARVEKRLVDRERLDHGSGLLEDAEHGLARLGVGRHPRRHDDRVGTQPARLGAAHRRANAVCLCLVAGREHDAPAHDHRPAEEARVVTLLHRGVERVEVGMQDRGLARHERMFACGGDGRGPQ
jgi:hypothetical protein